MHWLAEQEGKEEYWWTIRNKSIDPRIHYSFYARAAAVSWVLGLILWWSKELRARNTLGFAGRPWRAAIVPYKTNSIRLKEEKKEGGGVVEERVKGRSNRSTEAKREMK